MSTRSQLIKDLDSKTYQARGDGFLVHSAVDGDDKENMLPNALFEDVDRTYLRKPNHKPSGPGWELPRTDKPQNRATRSQSLPQMTL